MGRVVEEQHSRIPSMIPSRVRTHHRRPLFEGHRSPDASKLTRARAGGLAVVNMQVRNLMRDVLVVPETKLSPIC